MKDAESAGACKGKAIGRKGKMHPSNTVCRNQSTIFKFVVVLVVVLETPKTPREEDEDENEDPQADAD